MSRLQRIIYAFIMRLSSFGRTVKVAVRRNSFRAVVLAAAVLLITGSFFEYSLSSVRASEEEEFCDLSFELYPEGEEAEKAVFLNGVMPRDASATAVEVSDQFINGGGSNDISEENPDASIVAAYDITITNGEQEYQPGEENPVWVEITHPMLSEESSYELWHIHDDGEKEIIDLFTVEDGKIGFTATGFSVYAIVEIPGPFSAEEAKKLTDLEGSRATAGFCLYYGSNKYFTSTLNGNGALVETGSLSAAAVWFIKKTGDYYTISTIVNGQEKFIHTKSGNEIELSDSADLFAITTTGSSSFYLKNSVEDKWLQHSGSGSGIRYYQSNSNTTNSRIRMVFADSLEQPDDWYKLNGKSYGLMNYPGGTLGYAFMSEGEKNSLSMLSLNVRRETGRETLYVAEDSNITMWTFHYISDNNYKISTTVNGETKYLRIGNTLSLVNENQASSITVTTDSKNHLRLSSGGKAVTFAEDGFVSTSASSSNVNQQLYLVELSELTQEDYITYYAEKISVSDVEDGTSVIVYTRVWNDDSKAYDFYAIDHDGTLYPCYEEGDSITWVGSRINTLLWDFTEYRYDDGTPKYYYELYNSYSRKFIAPQIQDGQTLSDSKIGINLPGRRYGDYYSDIIAWDTPYYTYAGLQSDIENDTIISGPKSEADTYYFATVRKPVSTLTEDKTVDSAQYGVIMKMINFPVQPDEEGHSLQNEFLGTGPDTDIHATQGLLTTNIDPATGYPCASWSGNSLSDLFGGATEVNHLFLESTYYDSGYFEFDSCQNFATLVRPDGTIGTDFTVYNELGTTDTLTRSTLKHGQFFPYNSITAGSYAVNNPENLYSALAQYGYPNVGLLPESDPRKYEKLHLVNGKPDYYYGMEMTAQMVQSPSGKDSWGHDIVFEFTGDDDFWFYVDNELVIDLGGIHSALSGSVNFATGKVIIENTETDLRTIFTNNYLQRHPNASQSAVNAFLAEYFDGDETVFKDYTAHQMRIFYMERGAGAANLHMRFNLDPITPGNVLLTKTVSGTEDIDFNLVEYPFQIWYKDRDTLSEHLLTNDDSVSVEYQNSIQRVDYVSSYTPNNSSVTFDSVYFLDPGKSAEIAFPVDTVEYRIIECGINHEVYDTVTVNGTVIEGTAVTGTDRKLYDSGWLNVSQRPIVVFDNHVANSALRTLSFTKKLYDERGNELTAEQDSTEFSFRLYLSNGADDELVLANMAKYYVADPEGKLCSWDPDTQSFASSDLRDYSSLTSEQKALFTFETSMYGSIAKIPAGYSVEVPNIPVGTKFMVVERENEIPAGYSFMSYERIGGSYQSELGDTLNSGWVRANESPKMVVNNKRGWSIDVTKVWSDSDFTVSHGPIFIAVYCGDTLVPDTVSCIAHPSVSKHYFFDSLLPGADFEDYRVYEVKLDGPVVGPDGRLVSYSGIRRRIENGERTNVNATAAGSAVPVSHQYDVTYNYGTPVCEAQGTNVIENVRRDTITNTRTDGIALTLYDMHTNEPLAGGKFTLKQGDTVLGTYTSDQQGRITVFYDFERNTDYTLTETAPPAGYIGLPAPAVFSVGNDDSVTLSGNGQEWQNANGTVVSGGNLIAYLDFFNKPFELIALKVDSASGEVLSGAHFALYRSVTGIDGEVKDLEPIQGYSDLVSDQNGVIPRINKSLQPGKYYLTETSPPQEHYPHKMDIVFTVTSDGVVTINSEGHSGYLTVEGTDVCNYVLRIPNAPRRPVELTITKTVDGSFGDRTKDFTFTLSVEGAEATDEYPWSKNGVQQDEPIQNNSSFTLRHGDVVKIMLPVNSNITVSEDNEDYSTSFRLNDTAATPGDTRTFLLTDNATLAVTNHLDAIIPAGVFNTGAGIEIIILAGFFLCVILAFIVRRFKNMGRQY